MMNTVAAACINNRESSGDDDGRYKQLIYSGNIGENYKDESIAQQRGRATVTAAWRRWQQGNSNSSAVAVAAGNSCNALHVMTE